jgi:hypothetical protein
MERLVEPELLDELPPADPRAVRSRRDLQRVNRLMDNDRILAAALRDVTSNGRPSRLIEIGTGDGTLLLRTLRLLDRPPSGSILILLDQQPVVTPQTIQALTDLGWEVEIVVADAMEWLGRQTGPRSDAMVANLFLHHFKEDRLAELFRRVADCTNALVAIDPIRGRLRLELCRWLWLVGCNDVTRHDAVASIRAGFSGQELSRLWPGKNSWGLEERAARFFSHLFIARKTN